jgi:hypothetical protein
MSETHREWNERMGQQRFAKNDDDTSFPGRRASRAKKGGGRVSR